MFRCFAVKLRCVVFSFSIATTGLEPATSRSTCDNLQFHQPVPGKALVEDLLGALPIELRR